MQKEQESQETIRKKIDTFFAEYVSRDDGELKRNAYVKMFPTKKDSESVFCPIATFYDRGWQGGITQKRYEENKEYIESKLVQAEEEKKRLLLERSWIVCGLTNRSIDHVLAKKALPFNVYRAINAHYISSEDADEMNDDFGESAGWYYDEKILEQEARKVATEEQLALAEEIKRETSAQDEVRKAVEAERNERKQAMIPALALLDEAEKSAVRIAENNYSPQGETIQDPRSPQNAYGGGQWWIIEQNRILIVRNNGMDGDDWSWNNIKTGGAGAVGREFAKTDELVRALQVIKENSE